MLSKVCFKCDISKSLDDFYKHPEMPDGHVNKCKECNKKDVQTNYRKNIQKYKEYDKTRQRFSIKRILDHRYNSLVQRATGRAIHLSSAQNYPYLTRDEYDVWAKDNMEQFMKLYVDWQNNNFKRTLAPSIDRKDNFAGYIPDNMRWITQSENSIKHTNPI